MRRSGFSVWLVLATCALAMFVPLSGLALADFLDESVSGLGFMSRAHAVIDNGDRTHYAIHLALGRVLDLCPCTHDLADTQYWRARFHARTPHELQLVTQDRPVTPVERVADAADIVSGGVRWTMRGLSTTILGALDQPRP
jgi:hypothetical protein